MTPRANSQQDVETDFPASLEEFSQVSLPRPIPCAFNLLMMNPENIGGDDADRTSLDFEKFVAPFWIWASRKTKLARDEHPWLAVTPQTVALR